MHRCPATPDVILFRVRFVQEPGIHPVHVTSRAEEQALAVVREGALAHRRDREAITKRDRLAPGDVGQAEAG